MEIKKFNEYNINEGLRDQMKPISEEEIDKKIDKFIDNVLPQIIKRYSNKFEGEDDIIKYLKNNKDKIIKLLNDGNNREWESVANIVVREKPIEIDTSEIVHYGGVEDKGYFLVIKDKDGNTYNTPISKNRND
jgi:hypothetical protein